LNNFSGSPKILSLIIEGLGQKPRRITLATSLNNRGFLSDIRCFHKENIPYTYKRNRILRLLQFTRYQLLAARFVLKVPKEAIIYINTTQPFLPAIIARLRGQKVIYHIHEAYPNESLLVKALFCVMQIAATRIICVSKFVRDRLNLKARHKAYVVNNSLAPTYITKHINKGANRNRKRLLMVSSARAYKGVFRFCELAARLGQYEFILVCDASKEEINETFKEYRNIPNLKIMETQTELHDYYANADLILNLSDPNHIIETFGLTVLEGMSYGLPAIVPHVGGIAELVENDENGRKIDVNNDRLLINSIIEILDNDATYNRMSENAATRASKYRYEDMIREVENIISSI
jgi:glycosyltransferase involved in cell wall biosynthesis